jgi:CRISPR-associated protein Cas1
MQHGWRILDFLEFKGELSVKNAKLRSLDDETGEVAEQALIDINVILIGIGVRLGAACLYHFAKYDIVALFCDWKGVPVAGSYSWLETHGRVTARQRAQANLSEPRSKNAWMRITKAKISGQANTLAILGMDGAKHLKELSGQVRSGDPSNIEGQAARQYWSGLFADKDFRREPGAGIERRNMLLDYAYIILRGHGVRAVLSAGLAPSLALYHKNRANFFALADDLIEPFRPAVDYIVALQPPEATTENHDTKISLMEAAQQKFAIDGSTIPSILTDFAQQFGRYVEGEIETLQPPIWEPLKLGLPQL